MSINIHIQYVKHALILLNKLTYIPPLQGTKYFHYICGSKVQDIVVGLNCGYKTVLQFIALVLALLTRKVKVKGLNDAKYIAAMVYFITIVILVLAVCYFTIAGDRINLFLTLISSGLVIVSTFVLMLVFIPTVSAKL